MADRQNIVMIMCDQLRPDFLGPYGADFIPTPNLDALAADGTVFDKKRAKFRQIDRFLSRNCNQVASSYHIFVPRNTVCVPDPSKSSSDNAILLEDILTHDPTFFEGGDWHLHSCLNLEAEELRPSFVELMCQHDVTSIDVTGGKPLALHSLEFKAAAAAPEALRNTCQAAAVMTKLALDYLTNEEFRSRVGLSTTEV